MVNILAFCSGKIFAICTDNVSDNLSFSSAAMRVNFSESNSNL